MPRKIASHSASKDSSGAPCASGKCTTCHNSPIQNLLDTSCMPHPCCDLMQMLQVLQHFRHSITLSRACLQASCMSAPPSGSKGSDQRAVTGTGSSMPFEQHPTCRNLRFGKHLSNARKRVARVNASTSGCCALSSALAGALLVPFCCGGEACCTRAAYLTWRWAENQ